MLRFVSALAIFAIVFVGQPAVASGVTVTVNGQPLYLNPGPIEQAGRVFVPLRGIFERLGASVVYQSGQINSTKGNTTVSLTIGSRQATVNGQQQTLDVAPFIVGATTYVPLRFVAQSLGAQVDYNGNTQLVAITAPGGGGGYAPPPPRPNYPPPMPPPATIVQVGARQPSPDGRYADRFVQIGGQFSHVVDPNSVRVWLDGNDITSRSNVTRNGFSYRPPAPYGVGRHEVRVAGVDRNGRRFTTSWFFTTTGAPVPPPTHVIISGRQPGPESTVDNRFALIAASFAPPVEVSSIRVRLDGNDITGRAGVSGGSFSYKPPAPLDFGSHTVRVNGRGRSGLPFDSSWTFTVRRSGPPQISLTINQPAPNAVVGRNFTVAGSTAPNASVSVTAGASQSAAGQFNGNTTAGPKGNFQISVTLKALMGQQSVTVRITASDSTSSQTAEKALQLRFRAGTSAADGSQ